MQLLVGVGVTLTTASLLLSAGARVHTHEVDCDSASQVELLQCAEQDYLEADFELNRTYRFALGAISDSHRGDLRSVQRKWIRFRDNACDPLGDVEKYGREGPIERLACKSSLTKDRTDEIVLTVEAGSHEYYFKVINSLVRAGFSPTDVKERLASASSEDKLWWVYVDGNCALVASVSFEAPDDCKARMNLVRSY